MVITRPFKMWGAGPSIWPPRGGQYRSYVVDHQEVMLETWFATTLVKLRES